MLSVLKAQVTNLDSSRYKVMLVWDPDNARDVGWLTVEKNMKVDLKALQVRDVNLNKISLNFQSEPEPFNQNFADSNLGGEYNEELIVIEDDAKVQEAKCTKTNLVDDYHLISKGNKVQCSECKTSVRSIYFQRHMAKVHGQFLKNEIVKCVTCSVRVKKVNLKLHMKAKHSNVAKCVDCGNIFKSDRGLRSHRRWCMRARSKGTNNDAIAPKDIPERKPLENVSGLKSHSETDMIESAKNERVDFSILHEGRCYSCSRSKGAQIKGSLKKFCRHVGKDLKFEFEGRFLTGAEIVDTFSNGKILAVNI